MRTYKNLNIGNREIILSSLKALADYSTNVEDYRNAFLSLGIELGKVLAEKYNDIPPTQIMLGCASEDADWLGTGVECGFNKGKLKKSIYWNSRETVFEDSTGHKTEIAPIEKAFEEQMDNCQLLIIVKSIISSSCVVKTQLTRLIGHLCPTQIAIAAPVMYRDGEPNLRKEFPDEISRKFQFFTFAIDDERKGSEVVPGIGGMVYPRLGLGDINEKNSYIPSVVLEHL